MDGKVNLRVSTVPSTFGEKVVLRILDQSAIKLELSQLGLGAIGSKGISGCPVVDERGGVMGLLSQSDMVSVLESGSKKASKKPKLVQDIMSRRVITVSPQDTLTDAAQKMWRHKIHRVIVLHEGEIVGVITPFDFMLQTSLFSS